MFIESNRRDNFCGETGETVEVDIVTRPRETSSGVWFIEKTRRW